MYAQAPRASIADERIPTRKCRPTTHQTTTNNTTTNNKKRKTNIEKGNKLRILWSYCGLTLDIRGSHENKHTACSQTLLEGGGGGGVTNEACIIHLVRSTVKRSKRALRRPPISWPRDPTNVTNAPVPRGYRTLAFVWPTVAPSGSY